MVFCPTGFFLQDAFIMVIVECVECEWREEAAESFRRFCPCCGSGLMLSNLDPVDLVLIERKYPPTVCGTHSGFTCWASNQVTRVMAYYLCSASTIEDACDWVNKHMHGVPVSLATKFDKEQKCKLR